MILFRNPTILSLLIAVGVTATSSAAVLVTTQASAPVEDVLLSITPPTLNQTYSWSRSSEGAGLVQFGHSFTATSNAKMEKFTIRTGMLSATDAPFVLNIYQIPSITDGPLAGGTPIYTSTGSLPSAQGPRPGYTTFTLDAPVTLSEGEVYLFTLSYTGDETGGSLGFYRGEGAADQRDMAKFWYSSNGGETFSSSIVLLDFYIQGTAIPEASMAYLLLPGAAAATFLRRRKH